MGAAWKMRTRSQRMGSMKRKRRKRKKRKKRKRKKRRSRNTALTIYRCPLARLTGSHLQTAPIQTATADTLLLRARRLGKTRHRPARADRDQSMLHLFGDPSWSESQHLARRMVHRHVAVVAVVAVLFRELVVAVQLLDLQPPAVPVPEALALLVELLLAVRRALLRMKRRLKRKRRHLTIRPIRPPGSL
jgi:hypothetical protein